MELNIKNKRTDNNPLWKERFKGENKITLPVALILFLSIIAHFASVIWLERKLWLLEAFTYAVPEVAVFILYVHLTIGYTVSRKYAVYCSWGLPLTLISIAAGKISGTLFSIKFLIM